MEKNQSGEVAGEEKPIIKEPSRSGTLLMLALCAAGSSVMMRECSESSDEIFSDANVRNRSAEIARDRCRRGAIDERAILGTDTWGFGAFTPKEQALHTFQCGDISVETPESAALKAHCLESVRLAQESIRSACESYHRGVPTVCNQGANGSMKCRPVKDIPKRDTNPDSTQPSQHKPDPVRKAGRNR